MHWFVEKCVDSCNCLKSIESLNFNCFFIACWKSLAKRTSHNSICKNVEHITEASQFRGWADGWEASYRFGGCRRNAGQAFGDGWLRQGIHRIGPVLDIEKRLGIVQRLDERYVQCECQTGHRLLPMPERLVRRVPINQSSLSIFTKPFLFSLTKHIECGSNWIVS